MYKNFNHKWKRGRKLNNLRDALFTYGTLMMDVGFQDYETLRYRRCFNLASAFEDKIVEKWGDK